MIEGFIGIEEATNFLNTKKSWIYQNHKIRGLPHYYIGRKLAFKKSELSEWMAKERS